MSVILDQVNRLPVSDRIKLVEDIWDRIEAETRSVELSPEQRAELDRRIEDFKLNPHGGIPWEKARDEALARK
jgi:putative addiction module component (TIGR02574 family)